MMFTTWNPIREMEALRREVERAFESFGVEGGLRSLPLARSLMGRQAYPLVNVSEDKDNVYVEALAPGVDADTLEITVLRDTLRLAGEKQPLSAEIKPEAFHRNERTSGKFVRTVTLPVDVDGDKVSAEYKNGLLLVTLPKSEAAKPKQIAVKVD
jgi:HSP20 family protein